MHDNVKFYMNSGPLSAPNERKAPRMLRIDAHHHLWDQRVRPQSWMDDEARARIGGPYGVADWAAEALPSGISAGVFVQTVPVPEETPEVLALASDDPRLAAVVGWIDIEGDPRPAGEQLDALLAGPGGDRLAGIRVAAEYHPDPEWLDSPAIHEVAIALGERDLSLDLLTRPANLAAAEHLAETVPGTRMVLNHLGKPSMRADDFADWAARIAALGSHEHVACKLSGYLTFDAAPMTIARLRPYADTALAAFGPARTMFGSDWPVSVLGGGYRDAVDLAEQLLAPLSESERAAVWADTALAWYAPLARTDLPRRTGATA